MSFCFDLPELVDDFEEQDEYPVDPCFPYLVRGERPGGGNVWRPISGRTPGRLNLRDTAGSRGLDTSLNKKNLSRKGPVKVRCFRVSIQSGG